MDTDEEARGISIGSLRGTLRSDLPKAAEAIGEGAECQWCAAQSGSPVDFKEFEFGFHNPNDAAV
jgi:hypothetical protein